MADILTDAQKAQWRVFLTMRRQLDLTLERRLQTDAGISSSDYEILVGLYESPDRMLRAGQIADLIGWEKSRVSHQISRMEQRGLVSRAECGDDARGVWVRLEPDGIRAVVESLSCRAEALKQYFFDVLQPDELEVLARLSTRVLDTIHPRICDEAVVPISA